MPEKKSNLGKKVKIKKVRVSGAVEEIPDMIPSELLLTISLNKSVVSTISCTPDELIELTIGYLINNGYISRYSDISLIRICGSEVGKIIKKGEFSASIEVESGVTDAKVREAGRSVFISSACGSIDDFVLASGLGKIKNGLKVKSGIILGLNRITMDHQRFKNTFGGLHSAALFDRRSKLIKISEDIGRHNCIDKLTGFMQIRNIDPSDKMIFTTGRLSIDVIYKLGKMSVPIIVTNSSITHGAAVLAKRIRLTAIGYARGGRFNIYSGAGRIIT